MIITISGLEALVKVVISCHPIGQSKKKLNEKYLVDCFRRGEDINFIEFKKGLLEGSVMYENIYDFAIINRRSCIDEDLIWRYFGNKNHIIKSHNELVEAAYYEINPMAAHRMLIMHTLIPLEVSEVSNGTFSGIYRNKGFEITLRNFIVMNWDLPFLSVGKVVLVHYPLLVASDLTDLDLISYLNQEQLGSYEFSNALTSWNKKVIDHNRLPELKKVIANAIKEYKLK